jgi:DNA-binding NtrC family response regulator
MLGSPAMREIFAHLEKVAPSELTCLITGETGTGKEMVARALHNATRKPSCSSCSTADRSRAS